MPPLKPNHVSPTPEEEARIDAGIALDPDNPELTEEDFARMRPAIEVVPEIVAWYLAEQERKGAPTRQPQDPRDDPPRRRRRRPPPRGRTRLADARQLRPPPRRPRRLVFRSELAARFAPSFLRRQESRPIEARKRRIPPLPIRGEDAANAAGEGTADGARCAPSLTPCPRKPRPRPSLSRLQNIPDQRLFKRSASTPGQRDARGRRPRRWPPWASRCRGSGRGRRRRRAPRAALAPPAVGGRSEAGDGAPE